MRKPIIAGNWKMNKLIPESISLVKELKEKLEPVKDREIVVCPPFTLLFSLAEILQGSNIILGAQNLFAAESGAYTGEISPLMLKELGVIYCIIGHSERRKLFGEDNSLINQKSKIALKLGIKPIICIGETLEEREKAVTFPVMKEQITGALAGLSTSEMANIVIAYEPIWAIGTGKTATCEQAEEVHSFIRKEVSNLYGERIADSLRIQYGGSVKPENITSLMEEKDIDGALVGGASLSTDSFSKIVKY
ncbi:MAG: triose-phosphate isomerase [Candidatus Omnitrophica bacterium]|nr:triose-phosphate isomerase [Candidatus Omnitrophota bacterium]